MTVNLKFELDFSAFMCVYACLNMRVCVCVLGERAFVSEEGGPSQN